jgi:hypothetical protein
LCKVRLTGRKQWFDQDDAPELQTLSFNGRVGEKAGAGIIVFNEKMDIIPKRCQIHICVSFDVF